MVGHSGGHSHRDDLHIGRVVLPYVPPQHRQQDGLRRIHVVGHLFPAVQRGVLHLNWYCVLRLVHVPRKAVVDFGTRCQQRDPLHPECHVLPQLCLPFLQFVPEPLPLKGCEGPQLSLGVAGHVLIQIAKRPDLKPLALHLRHNFIGHRQVGRGHQIDFHTVEDLQPVRLGVGRPGVEEVPDQHQMDLVAPPVELLQIRELVEVLVCGVAVLPIPGVDQCGHGDANLRRKGGKGVPQPRAGALLGRPDDEDGLLRGVPCKHPDGVSDALLLAERRAGSVKIVHLYVMELGRVQERVPRPFGVAHEEQVNVQVQILHAELLDLVRLALIHGILEPPCLGIEIQLLLHCQVSHHIDGAPQEVGWPL
mmetsp:Transcript_48033/g.85741  ORF Transcript_48033/g.85741 Transcript_48033/m.85741 type:complete len:364 (+) Transcript_48033:551-1642(+)